MPQIITCARHLHANFEVVSSLEVMPLDGAGAFNDSTIALILVANQVLVLSRDRWVVTRAFGIIVERSALLDTRDVVVEDTKTVATIRMSNVVVKLAQLLVLWAYIWIKRWANGCRLKVIPVRVTIRTTSVVTTDNVVGVGKPDRGRRLISVKERPGAAHIKDKVVLDKVLGLNTILNEDSVTHSVVGNIVLHAEIVNAMDCHCTVE